MSKALYKNKANGMIFGVCAGLSETTGINLTVLRLLTVIGAVFTGSLVLWIYLLLGIVLQNKES